MFLCKIQVEYSHHPPTINEQENVLRNLGKSKALLPLNKEDCGIIQKGNLTVPSLLLTFMSRIFWKVSVLQSARSLM